MTTNDIMESLKMEPIWRSNQPLPSALLDAIEEGLRERDALRAALRQIGQAVEHPDQDQLENWIAGQVNTALGEVGSDKPDPLAPVVVKS